MNILIIAHHFPPENAIASLRPYCWAKYWTQLGHKVCVLTTQKHSFDSPQNLTLPLANFAVEEVPYLPPTRQDRVSKPISFLRHEADRAVWKETPKLVRQFALSTRKIRENIGTGALLSVRSLWVVPAVQKALSLHDQMPFDLLISTYGPPAPHIIAGQLKKKLRTPFWVADYRDLWNDYNLDSRRWPFSAIENELESRFVRRADMVTTVSSPLADILRDRFNKATLTIENGFDLSDLDMRRQDFFPKDGKIRLAYTGTLHPKKRNPLPLLKAVEKLMIEGVASEENLEILFYSNSAEDLPKFVHDLKVESIVKIPGFVDRAASLSIQASVDALIFIDWSDTSIDGILTGKIFEYLYAGKPILGIGSDQTRSAGRLLTSSRTGLCLGNSVEDIASVIEKMLRREPIEYSPEPSILRQYTREYLAEKMLKHILAQISL